MLVSISAKVDMATNTLAFYPATSDLFLCPMRSLCSDFYCNIPNLKWLSG